MNNHSINILLSIVICAAQNDQEHLMEYLRKAYAEGISHEVLYEALLQIHLFAGFPASIEGLNALHSIYGDQHVQMEQSDSAIYVQRGEHLCKEIYTTVYDKMMQRMQSISPDLAHWMILDGYGKTLSRPGLPIQDRELINLVILAMGSWKQQFISHLRGSLNIGISLSEIHNAIDILRKMGNIPAYDFAYKVIEEYTAS